MNTPYNTDSEEKDIENLANSLGIELDLTQLHIGGERAILSPHKLVLTGKQKDTKEKIILKCAKHPAGVSEIKAEHDIQEALKGLPFAEQELIMPIETFYGKKGAYTAVVTKFIAQDKVFTDYSVSDQFFMTLHAFEAQETFHATTREHHQSIRDKFTHHSPDFYQDSYQKMWDEISLVSSGCDNVLERGFDYLHDNRSTLKAMDGYLIHFDLVPHNFRIYNRQLYLLDFVSFRLGNKYEGWARFINFMEIHSPELVPLLVDYVKQDRGEFEYTSLRLMRIYKAVFLLHYYANAFTKTKGNLKELTKERLTLWCHIIDSVIADQTVNKDILDNYYEARNRLRTPEEKERQKEFTWV